MELVLFQFKLTKKPRLDNEVFELCFVGGETQKPSRQKAANIFCIGICPSLPILRVLIVGVIRTNKIFGDGSFKSVLKLG